MEEIPEPTRWRVDSVASVIQVRLPEPGKTLTVHNDGEHFWVTNEAEGTAYRAGREDERKDHEAKLVAALNIDDETLMAEAANVAAISLELHREQLAAERRAGREDAARDIEVNQGDRCPKCGGKAASTTWTRGRWEKVGRCGCGHTWTVRGKDYRPPADLARGTT